MKIAVVILNWNGRKLLEEFLPSVWKYSHKEAEVVVADNASTDDSVAFIQEHYPEISIVQNAQNFGFAGGYNEALKHVEADIFVLLNSDVEVTKNWITPIAALMQENKSIAACMPKIKAYQQKTHFEYAGAAGGFLDSNAHMFCRGRIFDHLEEDQEQYNDTKEIFWATGAAMFMRADRWHEVGGLDEDFFAHMEEIDLCYRLKNQGHQIYYCGASTVYHLGGGTLSALNARKTYLNFRNNLFLLVKNHYSSPLFFKVFYRLCLDGIAGAKFLFSGQFNHFGAVLKAHFSFYGKLSSYLKKRKTLRQKAANPNLIGVYQGQIVFDSFLRKKKRFEELDQKKFIQ